MLNVFTKLLIYVLWRPRIAAPYYRWNGKYMVEVHLLTTTLVKVWKQDDQATPETHPLEWKPTLGRQKF